MSENKEEFLLRIIEFYGKKLIIDDLHIKAYSKHGQLKNLTYSPVLKRLTIWTTC